METFIDFDNVYISRFTNALHAAYHAAIWEELNLIAKPTDLHLSETRLSSYEDTTVELTDRNKIQKATVVTVDTHSHDTERDRLLSLLFFTITNSLRSSDADEKAAAQLLEVTTRPYKGIQNEPDDAETQSIRGLVSDLQNDKEATAVQTLSLNGLIEKLTYANESFAEAKKSRIKARQEKALQVSTEDLRKEADLMLEEIKLLIRASGIIASETEGQSGVATVARNLINDINGITRNFRMVYNQSMAQKKQGSQEVIKPEEKPDIDDPEIPEDPKEEEEGENEGNFEPIPVEKQ